MFVVLLWFALGLLSQYVSKLVLTWNINTDIIIIIIIIIIHMLHKST
jgi:hypothetical protein